MHIRVQKFVMGIFLWLMGTVVVLGQQSTENHILNSAENRYNLLLSQVNIYNDLQLIADEQKPLIQEANQYASHGEFEIAIVYLEEALSSIRSQNAQQPGRSLPVSKSQLSISVLTGVDFNRQEFEIGYLESDSTVLEEINKPYGGIRAEYLLPTGLSSQVELFSEIRYDEENWRNHYRLGWRQNNDVVLFYKGYWNQSEVLASNSFWEHELDTRVGWGQFSDFSWFLQNSFTLKDYKNSSTYISDYYRNRFAAYLEWQCSAQHLVSTEFMHELNEALGRDDNDYMQATFRPVYRYFRSNNLNLTAQPEVVIRDYSLEYEDSTLSNRYYQVGLDVMIQIPLYKSLRIELGDEIYLKRYREKTELEPDYRWNTLRSSLVVDLSSSFDIGIGYEWESKNHSSVPNSIYDVTEQNFNAHGISFILNYFTLGGTYISSTASYQWRRYPFSVTNDLFSIYSDRNIFSVLLMAFIPLTENLNLNQFVTYDSDKDRDLDQQNNQSIIFTVELEYKF